MYPGAPALQIFTGAAALCLAGRVIGAMRRDKREVAAKCLFLWMRSKPNIVLLVNRHAEIRDPNDEIRKKSETRIPKGHSSFVISHFSCSVGGRVLDWLGRWSERQDLNLRRLGPKPSALARLSYAPTWCDGRTFARRCQVPRNDEIRNPKVERNPNAEVRNGPFRISSFGLLRV